MKKGVAITAGVVIVGAGLWLGGTWYTGQRIEAESAERLAQANEDLAKAMPGYNVKVEQISFSRTFFQSDARYALTFVVPPELAEAFPNGGRLEFDAHYQHGPFPGKALAAGHFAPSLAFVHSELVRTPQTETWFKLSGDKTPLWSDMVLGYSGNATMHSEIAPLTFAENDVKLAFSGAVLKGDYTRSNKGTKGTMTAASFTGEGPDRSEGAAPGARTALKATDLAVDFDLRQGKFDMQTGSTEMRIKDVSVDSAEFKLGINDFAYGAKSEETDQFVNGSIWYRAGALNVNSQALGSQQFTMKLDRLDGKTLANVVKLYNQVAAEQMAAGQPADQLPPEQLQKLGEAALPLLANNPTIALEPVSWKTDKGESTLNLKLTLAQPANAKVPAVMLAQQVIKSLDTKLVLNKTMVTDLTAKFLQLKGLTPDVALAQAKEQTDQLAGMAVMMNAGKIEGDNIISTLTYADGKINLNGREMPADAMLGAIPQ
ncbi:hypothetical protein CAL27_00080 [Bordetella genomosp. 1]|uniref:DUF945 domain-containing protein n=1 Tax=Bordetella genomosp. 1 TaxID=1395607 RepID=A0ABX4F2B4_9BORD|nr:hypothetical protein CAL27_00080 [Bordetella genomosp. 1]